MGRDAYHSPEMILKIRKANQNEPAGDGSVPWRHRLGIDERREFVMAEIRRPGASKDRARGIELDIQRAVMAARNPKDSKFGECLINLNTKQDPVLKSRLCRLSTEKRRMEFRLQQLRQHFMKTSSCANHEPLILVERPASPQVKLRAKVIEHSGEDPDDLNKPGYMKPLKSRSRTPSTLTTIDAFTLKTKKKRNVWEEAMDEKEPPRFTSTIRPAARLTRHEQAALAIGRDAHKPKLDAVPATSSAKDATSGSGGKTSSKILLSIQPPPPRKQLTSSSQQQQQQQQQQPEQQQPSPPPPEKEPDERENSFFVTQLPRNKDHFKAPGGLLLKSEELDRLLAIGPTRDSTSSPAAASAPTAAPETAEAEAEVEEEPAGQAESEAATQTERVESSPPPQQQRIESSPPPQQQRVESPPPPQQLQRKTSRARKVAISDTPIFITT